MKRKIILLLFLLITYYISSINESFDNHLYKWNNANINNQNKLINTFKKNGCIIIPNILSNNDCNQLLKIISKEKKNKNKKLGKIGMPMSRRDMLLSLKTTKNFIKKIYDKIKTFCNVLIPDAKIVENSSFISYPGAQNQQWHTDIALGKKSEIGAELISFGIALDDISPYMGPLEVFLGSNKLFTTFTNYTHGFLWDSFKKVSKKLNLQKVKCCCKKGSLVIWSSKVVHRGSANIHKKRPVFYFSLMGKGKPPFGATYSLKSKDKLKKNYVKDL
jgi:hypothetical protein